MRRRDFLSGSVLTYCAATTVTTGIVWSATRDDRYVTDDSKRWIFSGGRSLGYFRRPVVVDGTVFAIDEGGTTYAVDASDGTERWQFEIEASDPEEVYIAVANGIVVSATSDGIVYALEADTGAVRWRTELLGFDHRSPKVVDDLVLVPGAELDALGRDSGEVQWTVPLSGWVTSTDGEAFAADTGVGAVDLATGERRWYRELPADARASIPRVTDGTVVVGTSAGTVRAFDADTGDPLWQCRGDWRAIGSPSLYDGTAYVSFGDPAYFEGGSLVALDLADGTEQWKRLVDEIQTPPAVSGDVGRAGGGPYKWGPTLDVVLLGTSDEIVAYNQYGDRVWRINERPDNGLAPILADGAVYYSTSSALVGHKVSPQEGWAT